MAAEADRVLDVLRTWDTDGSGVILQDELRTVVARLCPDLAEEQLNVLLAAAAARDGAGSNEVMYEEFISWLWADGVDAEDVEFADEAKRRQGLWEGALVDAGARAVRSHPSEQVRRYLADVRSRLESAEYKAHVRGVYFDRVDADGDGKVSFAEASAEITKSLQCAADLGLGRRPTEEEVRAAFDAHDTLAEGRGRLGPDEFLNLARYLQAASCTQR